MNPNLSRLRPYPFERLAQLKHGLAPPPDLSPIALSIGEPRHTPPSFIAEEMIAHLDALARYPVTRGESALREAIVAWLTRRFRLPPNSLDPDRHVLPVNGTREALFAFAQCVVSGRPDALVLIPNPFYQIYEGAALLAGAQPWYMNCTAKNGFAPELGSIPEHIWQRCELIYICNPGNPSGAVLDTSWLRDLLGLAERHDFLIASDECYSEIYLDENAPPPGLLQAAAEAGVQGYRRCVVFHSLSKRSNVPGLRSGAVAGDAQALSSFLRYRTYHGCAMSPPVQSASIRAWGDEAHVRENRRRYREKFDAVLRVLSGCLPLQRPRGAFYLWPETPVDDLDFTRRLYAQKNVTVLPGTFLSRESAGVDPGRNHVRMALVAPLEECLEAARRVRELVDAIA